jgi:hypothetical protein
VLIHRANSDFWSDYKALPADIQARADKQFALLESNPEHPSLQFKKLGTRNGQEVWSARVTLKYRSMAVRFSGEFVWFWIGDHGEYDERSK